MELEKPSPLRGFVSMQKRDCVLIVEDDHEIRDLLILQLRRDGYQVDAAATGEEALSKLQQNGYDLLILDWMLPGVSGLEIARTVRKNSSTQSVGILMVTARVEPGDVISGLESGADDYVTKPFDNTVLLARVRALLRRAKAQAAPERKKLKEIQIENLKLNLDSHQAFCGAEQIHLTPSEFKLLQTLAMEAGKVFTREALIREVQGMGVSVVDRAIDTHVFGLRKKLGDCANVLETVRGIGYRVKPPETN